MCGLGLILRTRTSSLTKVGFCLLFALLSPYFLVLLERFWQVFIFIFLFAGKLVFIVIFTLAPT